MDELTEIKIRANFRRIAGKSIVKAENKFIEKLKSDPSRSPEPWNAYPFSFHLERMGHEYDELQNAKTAEQKRGECLDVGLFAMFGWASLEEDKK